MKVLSMRAKACFLFAAYRPRHKRRGYSRINTKPARSLRPGRFFGNDLTPAPSLRNKACSPKERGYIKPVPVRSSDLTDRSSFNMD